MSHVVAIARTTLNEVIRHRILYLLAACALGMIVFSRFVSLMTVGQDEKIIKDMGLAAINLIGVMITLFVGVGLIFKEMERRTVQTTLALPVARWQYILGKFGGLAAAITINTVVMAVVLFGLLLWRGAFDGGMVIAVYMLWVELIFITAAAVFFSSFSTPIFTALFTAMTYLVGHTVWSLDLLANKLPEGLGQSIVRTARWLIPDLEQGDIRPFAVHGQDIPMDRVLAGSVYELGYAALLMLIACVAFRRRDLI